MTAKIFAGLVTVLVFAAGQQQTAQEPRGRTLATALNSASALAGQFCEMHLGGAQLTSEGWERIALMFDRPGSMRPLPRTIGVVEDRCNPHIRMTGDRTASVRIVYTHLGFLEPQNAVFRTEATGLHLFGDMDLILTEGAAGGPPVWKIKGAVPEAALRPAAAIRYLTELRAKTRDPKVRRNADRAVVLIKQLVSNRR